jgi:F-type H+-transporting ATPase subunit a
MSIHAALVALALALGQPGTTEGQSGPGAESGEGSGARPAPGHGAQGEGGHGEEQPSLSEALLHHVSNTEVVEYPGYCHGGFRWDCELDLRAATGGGWAFEVGGVTFDMTPSKHLVMMWLAGALLLVLLLSATRRRSLVPKGLYNFFELLVQFVRDELAVKNIGKKDADRFVPYLCAAFFFILFMNLFGLIPYAATATGNVAVTMGLAAFTFVITQYTAIRAQGLGGWLKHLTGGVAVWLWPIMIPVELLGLFTKPFALTIRLFANMVAGHIVILSLIGLIFALGTGWVALASVPMAIAIFLLEIFVAFVQAYIFTLLSALFIGQGLVHHDEHGEEHDHGAAAPGEEARGHGGH